jgi:hypothetical protein
MSRDVFRTYPTNGHAHAFTPTEEVIIQMQALIESPAEADDDQQAAFRALITSWHRMLTSYACEQGDGAGK